MPRAEINTRRGKRAFIRGLVRSVEWGLLADVPKMPAEWDGHELRRLIAERFALAVFGDPGRSRIRSYHNARRVLGL